MAIGNTIGSNNIENSSNAHEDTFSQTKTETSYLKQSIEQQGGPIEVTDVTLQVQLDEMMQNKSGTVFVVELWGEGCKGCNKMYNPITRTGNIVDAKKILESQGYTSSNVDVLRLQTQKLNKNGMPENIATHTGWRDSLGDDFGLYQYKLLPGVLVIKNGKIISSNGVLDTDDLVLKVSSAADVSSVGNSSQGQEQNNPVYEEESDVSSAEVDGGEIDEAFQDDAEGIFDPIDINITDLEKKNDELMEAQAKKDEEIDELMEAQENKDEEIAELREQVQKLVEAQLVLGEVTTNAVAQSTGPSTSLEVQGDGNTFPLLSEMLTDDIGAIVYVSRGKKGRLHIRAEEGNKKVSGSMFLSDEQNQTLHSGGKVRVYHKSLNRTFDFVLKNGKLGIKVTVDNDDPTKAMDIAKKKMEDQKVGPSSSQEAVGSDKLIIDEMKGIDTKLHSDTWVIPESWDLDQEYIKKRFGLKDGDPMKGVLAIDRNEGYLGKVKDEVKLNLHGVIPGETKKVEFYRLKEKPSLFSVKMGMDDFTRDHIFVTYTLDPKTKKVIVVVEPSEELRDYYDPEKKKQKTSFQKFEAPQQIEGNEVLGVEMTIPGIEDDDLDIDIPDLKLSKDPRKIANGDFQGVRIHDYYRGGFVNSDEFLGKISWDNGVITIYHEEDKEIWEKPLRLQPIVEDGILSFEWVLHSSSTDGDDQETTDTTSVEEDVYVDGQRIVSMHNTIRGVEGYTTSLVNVDGRTFVKIMDVDGNQVIVHKHVSVEVPETVGLWPLEMFFDGEYIEGMGLLVPQIQNGVLMLSAVDYQPPGTLDVYKKGEKRTIDDPSNTMKALGIQHIIHTIPAISGMTTEGLEVFHDGNKIKIHAKNKKTLGRYLSKPMLILNEKDIKTRMGSGYSIDTKHVGIGTNPLTLKWKIEDGVLFFYRERPLSSHVLDAREAFEGTADRLPFDVNQGFKVTSEYGATESFRKGPHRGIDIGMPSGSDVYAVADGVLEVRTDKKGINKGYGKYVVVKHDNGMETRYGHLSKNNVVASGKKVKAGQLIGLSGSTGSGTGPHLDFSVRDSRNPTILTMDPTMIFQNFSKIPRKKGMQSSQS